MKKYNNECDGSSITDAMYGFTFDKEGRMVFHYLGWDITKMVTFFYCKKGSTIYLSTKTLKETLLECAKRS